MGSNINFSMQGFFFASDQISDATLMAGPICLDPCHPLHEIIANL